MKRFLKINQEEWIDTNKIISIIEKKNNIYAVTLVNDDILEANSDEFINWWTQCKKRSHYDY